MKHSRFVLTTASLASVLLAGCVGMPQIQTIPLSESFDEEKAQSMIEPGPNTVSGSALIRQDGGGIVTCAGNEVYLVPATAYAKERVSYLYANYTKGYKPYMQAMRIQFTPDEPAYRSLTKQTRCDAQGNFEFTDVANGDFYLSTHIVWNVSYTKQGGMLMQRVMLNDGQHEKVVMTP